MRHSLLILAIALASGCRAPAANPTTSGPEQPDEFHRLIRDTEMAVRPTAIDRPWAEVRARFDAAGYRPISSRDNQYSTSHVYLIRAAALTSRSGFSHDLIVEVDVDKHDPQTIPGARPDAVIWVAAGLLAKPNVAFDVVAGEPVYSPDSAVGRCFATDEFQDALKKYRVVREIEVSYELIIERSSDIPPYYGFRVRLQLAKDAKSDDTGKQLFFTMESGLDPAQDPFGRPPIKGEDPRPIFGEVFYRGGNEWGPS